MTCIVGLEHDGIVTIGGDSAGVAGYALTVRADTKVFTVGGYAMGFTTSFRMGQLLRYSFSAPVLDTWDVDRFMATRFVDAVRSCLKEGGYSKTESGREEGGAFLVGLGGRLYVVHSDFQIGRSQDGYLAVGCGDELALGALHSTAADPPAERVTAALEAAAHHSAGVSPPFAVVQTNRSDA